VSAALSSFQGVSSQIAMAGVLELCQSLNEGLKKVYSLISKTAILKYTWTTFTLLPRKSRRDVRFRLFDCFP